MLIKSVFFLDCTNLYFWGILNQWCIIQLILLKVNHNIMNPNFKSIETKKNENSKFFGFLVPFYQLIIIGNSIVCKKSFLG